MATTIDLISNIELRLSQANVSDDFQIDRRLIRSWLDSSRSKLINDKFKEDGSVTIESFLSLHECVPIKEIDKDCADGCSDSKFVITLPSQPIVVNGNDIGLYRLETQSGQIINRIKPNEIHRIKNLKFGKPSRKNIVYYRLADKLTIFGGSDNFRKGGKVNVFIAMDNSSNLKESDEYPISSNLITELLEMVEVIGRRVLGISEDIDNDGKQQAQPPQRQQPQQ